MHIGEFSAPHRAKFRIPFDPTKVRHFFQIRKDLGNYFSSISLIFSMNVSARFLGLNNLPLFAGKGMLSSDKGGLFSQRNIAILHIAFYFFSDRHEGDRKIDIIIV